MSAGYQNSGFHTHQPIVIPQLVPRDQPELMAFYSGAPGEWGRILTC